MDDEKERQFMESFGEAAKPLVEWLNANCRRNVRVYVMHMGAELIEAIAHYVPDEDKNTLN